MNRYNNQISLETHDKSIDEKDKLLLIQERLNEKNCQSLNFQTSRQAARGSDNFRTPQKN